MDTTKIPETVRVLVGGITYSYDRMGASSGIPGCLTDPVPFVVHNRISSYTTVANIFTYRFTDLLYLGSTAMYFSDVLSVKFTDITDWSTTPTWSGSYTHDLSVLEVKDYETKSHQGFQIQIRNTQANG